MSGSKEATTEIGQSNIAVTAEEVPVKLSSKKSRKDKLQPIATPDLEFEVITLDEDEDEVPQKKKRPLQKKTETNPYSLVNNACELFLADHETEKMVRSIAEERVRINYLLASFGMPDIEFRLINDIEQLRGQLKERIWKRRNFNSKQK